MGVSDFQLLTYYLLLMRLSAGQNEIRHFFATQAAHGSYFLSLLYIRYP